ncbi:MAG TPA: DapH/DapD/GlmU-related protein [Polyangiales bacterium]|nr:DapH/DapD/GlmU-related protein [Polyangiales bacterium]
MRRDHRPLVIKRASAALSELYARRYVHPQFDAIGGGSKLINPRHVQVNGPRIRVGEHLHTMATRDRPIQLTVYPDHEQRSRIDIGAYCIILPGVRIAAAVSIRVGDNCMFATNSYVTDADWHDLYDRTAAPGRTGAIELGDNVWIGDSAIVCKGVKIGDNSIVGAGSVVRTSVPANTIVAGNPAQPMRELDPSREFVKREALFHAAENYDEYIARYDAFMLKDNTLARWLRSLILPTREQ